MNAPHYHLVPKDLGPNMRFRRELIAIGKSDPKAAADLRRMCSEDPLFQINAFGWTYDPRKDPTEVPFLTYAFQDEAFALVYDALGVEDVGMPKSRDMGASWLVICAFAHKWQWCRMLSFLLLSWKEKLVDDNTDPKSLFWKLDFFLRTQPGWLRPNFERRNLKLNNLDNGSVINGETMTTGSGRGDRRTAILADEFAKWPNGADCLASIIPVSNSIIYPSTYQGKNHFWDVLKTIRVKIEMHWTRHPEKVKDSYIDDKGKRRSPWYDRECERMPYAFLIAQEIDMDPIGSAHQAFSGEMLNKYEREHVRAPHHIGKLTFDPVECRPKEWEHDPAGNIRLWIPLDIRNRLPKGRKYVVGADIAVGSGASNSTLSVVDVRTKEEVAMFADPNMLPHEFAKLAVALCHWFHGPTGRPAYLIWEVNGPGLIFGRTVIECGHTNIYYRENIDRVGGKRSNHPGWHSSRTTKLALIGAFQRALQENRFITASREAINEAKEYIYLPNGAIAHMASTNAIDPSGANDNHGDRVIAQALANHALKEKARKPKQEEAVVSILSLAGRRQAFERTQQLQEAY